MKKLFLRILILPLLLICNASFAQSLLSFNFIDSTGSEPVGNSIFNAAGVLPAQLTRSNALVATDYSDRFNATSWATSTTIDPTKYIEFTITPSSGYTLSMTGIMLAQARSNSGPKSIVARTSIDGFASDATPVIAPSTSVQDNTLTFYNAINATSPVTIRIYGYNAATTTGSWGPGQDLNNNQVQVMGSLITLPVYFTNLRGSKRNNKIEISWTNETEKDIAAYYVERSADGQKFTEINKVYPLNNNGLAADYDLMDDNPLPSLNFYRIKAIETSGKITYTNIIKLDFGERQFSFSLYPNPAAQNGMINIQMNLFPQGKYTLKIFNASAQLVRTMDIMDNGGSLIQGVQLNSLQRGMYILSIDGPVKQQQSFIIL